MRGRPSRTRVGPARSRGRQTGSGQQRRCPDGSCAACEGPGFARRDQGVSAARLPRCRQTWQPDPGLLVRGLLSTHSVVASAPRRLSPDLLSLSGEHVAPGDKCPAQRGNQKRGLFPPECPNDRPPTLSVRRKRSSDRARAAVCGAYESSQRESCARAVGQARAVAPREAGRGSREPRTRLRQLWPLTGVFVCQLRFGEYGRCIALGSPFLLPRARHL